MATDNPNKKKADGKRSSQQSNEEAYRCGKKVHKIYLEEKIKVTVIN